MTSLDPAAPSVLVFDVNETLLDIESLGPHFERIFGDANVLRTWFGELVTYSMTLTLSGYYVDFFALGRAVLQMVATIRDVALTDDDVRSLAEGMRTMPAHPRRGPPGLAQLRADGYRLVTLTNSPHQPNVSSPLDNAGLGDFFEHQFTVDTLGCVQAVDPPLPPGGRAARSRHVAVHDGGGAHLGHHRGGAGAGMRSALITRPGNAPLVTAGVPQPNLLACNITDLASLLKPPRPGRPPAAEATLH